MRTIVETSLQACLNRIGADAQFVDRAMVVGEPFPNDARAELAAFDVDSRWQGGGLRAPVHSGVRGSLIYVFGTSAAARALRHRLGVTAQSEENVTWIDEGAWPSPRRGPLPVVDLIVRRCIRTRSQTGVVPIAHDPRPSTVSASEYFALRAAAGDLRLLIATTPGLTASAQDPLTASKAIDAVSRVLRLARGQPGRLLMPWPELGSLAAFLADTARAIRSDFPGLAEILVRRPRLSTPEVYFTRACGAVVTWARRMTHLHKRFESVEPTSLAGLDFDNEHYLAGVLAATDAVLDVLRRTPPPFYDGGLEISSRIVRQFALLRRAFARAERTLVSVDASGDYSRIQTTITAINHNLGRRRAPLAALVSASNSPAANLPGAPVACTRLEMIEYPGAFRPV